MARRIQFVPRATANGGPSYDLADIPEAVKKEVEEMYAASKTADGRFRITFDTKAEMLQYQAMAQSYAAQRPAELGGPIRFRKSPSKGLPDNVGDFRVTDINVEAEESTEAIRDGVAAVKEEAAAVEVPKPAARNRRR